MESENVGMDDVGEGLDELEVLGVSLELGEFELVVGAEFVVLVV